MFRLVSLSHVNDPATTSGFPGDPEFRLETVATIERDGYHLQVVHEGEHTGTHWGAPGHFTAGEPLADELDVDDLCRPAVVVDVRDRCAADADYEVGVDDLLAWERVHGRMPGEAVVIARTGWAARWGTAAYPNIGADGRMHQPGFARAALQWLLDTGRLGRRGGLGTDTFGPDPGRDGTYAVSRLLYRRHRISCENLTGLDRLPAAGAWILCGGQINRCGSGSTALIYGVIPAAAPR